MLERDKEERASYLENMIGKETNTQLDMARVGISGVLPLREMLGYHSWFEKDAPELEYEELVQMIEKKSLSFNLIPIILSAREKKLSLKEVLNGFRANRLSTILIAASGVYSYRSPDEVGFEGDSRPFARWAGGDFPTLEALTKTLHSGVERKKILGQEIQIIENHLSNTEYPLSAEQVAHLLHRLDILVPQSRISLYEAETAYSIGELMLRFLGDGGEESEVGVPLKADERKKLVQPILTMSPSKV